ncbi:MAG: phage tail protein [Anaerolineae bacterium]|nr:phage tail protein [Anaerolineae bacterium]
MSLVRLLSETVRNVEDHGQQISGVVVAVVRDIVDPDGYGRVRVDFPWLADKPDTVTIGDDDRAHSYWARVATIMAGGGRGSYFIPEVDDEVLVAFEHGRLDRPYIIGSLWNKKDAPPEKMDADGKNNIRAIHTRSGHRILLNDSDDAPSIKIVDKTGNNYILIDSKENAMTIKVEGDLTIDVGGKITIKAGQDIAIEAQANLSAKANQSGKVEAAQKLDLKSNMGVTVDGSLEAKVTAATVNVSGTAMTEIKGGLVKIN